MSQASENRLRTSRRNGVFGLGRPGRACRNVSSSSSSIRGRTHDSTWQSARIFGAVVLRVAEGHRRRHPAALAPLAGGGRIGPVDGDRGAIVVQLVQRHGELPYGVSHQRQQQRRLIAGEQLVHRPAAAVVVQLGHLLGREPEQLRGLPGSPLSHSVQRLPRDEQVPHQYQQRPGVGNLRSAVFWREILLEELFELHPLDRPIQQRQCPDVVRGQGLPALSGVLTRRDRSPRFAPFAWVGLFHRFFSLVTRACRPTAAGRQRLTLSRAKDCPVRKKVNPHADRSEGTHPYDQGARKEVTLLRETRPSKPRRQQPAFLPHRGWQLHLKQASSHQYGCFTLRRLTGHCLRQDYDKDFPEPRHHNSATAPGGTPDVALRAPISPRPAGWRYSEKSKARSAEKALSAVQPPQFCRW